jgi:hypothetical protein
MGTISGMTYIKIIFSFLSGTGKHFIGYTLSSSDDSVMQLIHILHFFTINNVFYKLLEEKSRGVKSGEQWGLGMGLPLPVQ